MLEKGEVVEFDTPAALIMRKGIFYDLVKESGLLEGSLTLRKGHGTIVTNVDQQP